jgi:16S rRNA (cytosine967-C5)-methyltransferase
MVTAREAALMAIAAGRKSKAWPETYLDNLVRKENIDRRDSALAYRLCCGVLQNMALLDYCIAACSSKKLNKLEPLVLDILRLSAYQLLFMDRIPARAVVNEGVELTRKKANPRASGYVNAVLRRIASEGMPEIEAESDVKYLSIKYSHPEWLVELLLDELGREDCEKYLAADNDVIPIYAQVNTLKASPEDAEKSLKEDSVKVENTFRGLELNNCGDPSALSAYRSGYIYVQDGAARLAVEASGVRAGMKVLDACAAPGGKSFAAAILMNNQGSILSRDIHEKKLGRITKEAERLGIDMIETQAADARTFEPELKESFDVVLADVPCSGLGVIRKKPDIRYKDGGDIEGLPDIQLAILTNLAKYVKPGGTLLYSTCTVLSRENSGVVERFLGGNGDFEPEPFDLGAVRSINGMLTLYPHIHGTDGFFIAKLRRRK